jgi:hypothetical protein
MKSLLLATCLLASTQLFSQSKIGPKDPCFADDKSIECHKKMSTELFFVTSVDGEVRPDHAAYVDAYFKKYGIEGFYQPASQYRPGSLFEYVMDHSRHNKLNKKLVLAFPKGGSLNGKNIYDLVIKTHSPFTRGSDMTSYLATLKVLFPEEDNADFQKTKELFGFPWDDPSFIDKYVERIQGVVKRIDENNDFFRTKEFLPEREQYLKMVARLQELQKISSKACNAATYEEYMDLRNKYGDFFKSKNNDVIGCLIKNEKYELAQKVIDEGGYLKENLPAYFDQAVKIKETPASFKLSQFLFFNLAKNGQKINPVKGETQRDFLQRGGAYLNKYHQEETICDIQFHDGNTINEMSKSLNDILFVEAYQLMQEILAEEDPLKKAELEVQFIQLKNVGVNLDRVHPSTGKSILHLIAEAGDKGVLTRLDSKGVSVYLIGDNKPDKNGKSPMITAIESGSLKHLDFAADLFKLSYHSRDEEMDEMKKALRKLKTDDKEIKAMKKGLLWDIKEEQWD